MHIMRFVPGENDGQMTMEYHDLPWSTMVVHSHMVDHGRPCFVKWPPMVGHGLINTMPNHGRPWSRTMVDHDRPWLKTTGKEQKK